MTYTEVPYYLVVEVPRDIAVGPFCVDVNLSQYEEENLNPRISDIEGLPVSMAESYSVSLDRARILMSILRLLRPDLQFKLGLSSNARKSLYFVYRKRKGVKGVTPVVSVNSVFQVADVPLEKYELLTCRHARYVAHEMNEFASAYGSTDKYSYRRFDFVQLVSTLNELEGQ